MAFSSLFRWLRRTPKKSYNELLVTTKTGPQLAFVWNDVIYPLHISPEIFQTQYDLMAVTFQRLLANELGLVTRDAQIVPTHHPAYVLGVADVRSIALPESLDVLSRNLPMGITNNFYNRFLNCLDYIHEIVDPLFLLALKGRFYRTQLLSLNGREGIALPTAKEWNECSQKLPWIWILPHYQWVFRTSGAEKEFISVSTRRP